MTHIMTHASNGTKTHLSHKFSTQFIMLLIFVLTSVTCPVFRFFINFVLPVLYFNAFFSNVLFCAICILLHDSIAHQIWFIFHFKC